APAGMTLEAADGPVLEDLLPSLDKESVAPGYRRRWQGVHEGCQVVLLLGGEACAAHEPLHGRAVETCDVNDVTGPMERRRLEDAAGQRRRIAQADGHIPGEAVRAAVGVTAHAGEPAAAAHPARVMEELATARDVVRERLLD